MPALTASERLEHLDEESEAVKRAFLEAAEHLNRSTHVPDEVVERLEEVTERVAQLPNGLSSADLDKDQLDSAWRALWDMRELLDRDGEQIDLDTLDGLLVAVERFRHVIRDALDEYVPGVSDDTALVVDKLDEWLSGVPKSTQARLLGVNVRTLPRWKQRSAPPAHRLAIVAKLVGILRHSWTPEGVVAWFERPHPDLGGRRPIDLLDKAEESRALISAARGTRSMYAT